MYTNLILLITSSLIFISYISFIVSKYGVIPSISESYYRLPYSLKILFTLFIWGLAVPIMIVASTPLMLLACGFICVVGVTQTFKLKLVGAIHSLAAIIGIGIGVLSLFFEFRTPLTAIAIIIGIALLNIFKVNNKTWWSEIIAFTLILLSLFLTQV